MIGHALLAALMAVNANAIAKSYKKARTYSLRFDDEDKDLKFENKDKDL